ncbi:MAG TPA: hypothetical protein VMK31_07840, partial [Sphingomicrobium sp.]|nr:hypothetical protein [Sphingomicrobium sp.]
INATAETVVRFAPQSAGAEAGLVALQSDHYWYWLSVGAQDGQSIVRLRARSGNSDPKTGQVLAQALLPVAPGTPVHLAADARGAQYDFRWSLDGKNWQILLAGADGRILSTKRAGGFVGAVFGLHAYKEQVE